MEMPLPPTLPPREKGAMSSIDEKNSWLNFFVGHKTNYGKIFFVGHKTNNGKKVTLRGI